MRILIYSPAFHPRIGGLEFMCRVLAEEFTALGHQVVVCTTTADPGKTPYTYDVVRRPSPFALLGRFRTADVVLHMNLSLRGLWPLAIFRRPLVIGHYGLYRRDIDRMGLRDRLKYWVSRFATNIACSEAVKSDLPADSVVIGNAYDDALFSLTNERDRLQDLVFVGRLVSEKGVDLLLESLRDLRQRNLRPTLTVVGSGPEETRLREICQAMHLEDQVSFYGTGSGRDLALLLNRHRVMVVPSRNEGFGLVALEGIASGCVVVGSDAGGLAEAIGNCGVVFRNGEVTQLSEALFAVLTDTDLRKKCLAARVGHLPRYTRRAVAQQYLNAMETVARHSERMRECSGD